MFRNLRIASRMVLLIVVGAGVILGLIIGYSYSTARRLLEEELSDKAQYLAQMVAGRIEVVERAVEKVAQNAAFILEREGDWSTPAEYSLLEEVVRRNPEIVGAAIAPVEYGEAPYVCRSMGDTLERKNLGAEDYRYDVWDWFTLPRDLGKAVWTEPYFDEGGSNVLMVTYSVPFYGGRRTNAPVGVVTCDISLEWLRQLMASLHIGRNGYAFLISFNGTFVSHPEPSLLMNETIFSLAEERNDPQLRELGQRMIRGEVGFAPFTSFVTGQKAWLAFAPSRGTGWSVGLVFPVGELRAKVISLSRQVLLLGTGGFLLLLLVALMIARSISRPLRELEQATHTLASGSLDTPVPAIAGEDEVAHLAASFETMRKDLKQHIADLQETTAAKERIESEMHIARNIQMSLVPRTFPPFPDRDDVELFGVLDPAREIGGDFYDFFLAGEDDLCLVIGDVSGKGIPAALFMAVTRTFLRSLWHEEGDPAATLTRLNDELARDNDSCMFVTLFCARVNLKTGECVYANGGHNPPYLIRKDGGLEVIPSLGGAVVGAMGGLEYRRGTMRFEPGDALFLYTDGVTEAMDQEGRLTGDDWAIEAVRPVGDQPCSAVVKHMREQLRVYARGAEQSDDITMLMLRYRGTKA